MKKLVLYNEKTKRYLTVHTAERDWVSWGRFIHARNATFYRDQAEIDHDLKYVLADQRRIIRERKNTLKAYEVFLATKWKNRSKMPKYVFEELRLRQGDRLPAKFTMREKMKGACREVKHAEKVYADLLDFKPTVIDVPIGFDKRKIKEVTVERLDVKSKNHCACCGVIIPHEHAMGLMVGYHNYYFCPICVKRIAESLNPTAEAFERENPEFMEAYHTEKFLMDL